MQHLYVYKLNPKTSASDVISALKPTVPEVKYKALDSKYPYEYSSFKITVYSVNRSKIMDPFIWPLGVYIRDFFFRRGQHPRTHH